MKSEEKNASPTGRVGIAVLGKISVGKSALTVRYLTRRFIGEYRSNTDLLYRQTVTFNSTPLEVEIVDVSGETRDSTLPFEAVQWADACVIVYSITDRQSYQYAAEALDMLVKMQSPVNTSPSSSPPLTPSPPHSSSALSRPVTLLANKADLEHLRQVEESEGRALAAQVGAHFYEVSVAENSSDIYQAFEVLVNESRCAMGQAGNNGKTRKFSVSKMIGTLIGNAAKNGSSYSNGGCGGGAGVEHNGANSTHTAIHGGTVVVWQKADLYRSRVLKRRQNYSATASL